MTTDILVYGIVLLASVSFGILGLYDRIYSIVALFIGFLYGLYSLNNGDIITNSNTYSTACSCWVSNVLSTTDTQILFLLLGLTALANFSLIVRKTMV